MIDFTKPCRRGHPKTTDHGNVTPDGYWRCQSCIKERQAGAPSTHNGAKVKCINGHPFTPENTVEGRQQMGQGRRRTCLRCRWERNGFVQFTEG